jgi:RHS repeat-associated protein
MTTNYTTRSQVAAISSDGPPPLASYTYDLDGRRTQKTLENGITTTYSYDVADQLLTLAHTNVNTATELARFTYTYDTGARRTSKASTGPGTIARSDVACKRGDGQSIGLPEGRAFAGARSTGGKSRQTYGYDAIDQVTTSNYGVSGTESFAYDAMGNRTTATLLGQGLVNYTANSLNQYTAINTAAPTYDANGNTLTLPGRTFSYDGQSRLTAAQATDSLSALHAASFVYDARNRQVSRTVDGTTTYFVWDGWSMLAEYRLLNGTLTQVARYVHGPRLDEILVQQRNTQPTPTYLHEDALGSTYLLTNAAGTAFERYAYSAFGEVSAFNATGAVVANPSTRFLYTGREWLNELGLNDHRNRFYLPSLGRWINRDPIGENGGVNLYAYVGNSVIIFYDARGLCCEKEYESYKKAYASVVSAQENVDSANSARESAKSALASAKESSEIAFDVMETAYTDEVDYCRGNLSSDACLSARNRSQAATAAYAAARLAQTSASNSFDSASTSLMSSRNSLNKAYDAHDDASSIHLACVTKNIGRGHGGCPCI